MKSSGLGSLHGPQGKDPENMESRKPLAQDWITSRIHMEQ
jgi:hypothetical protein